MKNPDVGDVRAFQLGQFDATARELVGRLTDTIRRHKSQRPAIGTDGWVEARGHFVDRTPGDGNRENLVTLGVRWADGFDWIRVEEDHAAR